MFNLCDMLIFMMNCDEFFSVGRIAGRLIVFFLAFYGCKMLALIVISLLGLHFMLKYSCGLVKFLQLYLGVWL